MTSVGAYLKKLLYQYDCVVVPELGGFLAHYQSASYSEATGHYLPPRKRLAFNEALRLDDGVLTNFMMLHEKLTRDEALRKINAFVTDLRFQVQQMGSFEVEGIGLFTQNAEGRLQFDPELRHNFFGESFGMAPVSVERVSKNTEAPIDVDAVAVTALGPVLGEEVIEQTPFVAVHRPQRIYVRWVAAALVIGGLGTLSYFTVIKPGQPLQSSLNPAAIFQIPSALTETWTKLTQRAPATIIRSTGPAVSPPSATPMSEPVALQMTVSPEETNSTSATSAIPETGSALKAPEKQAAMPSLSSQPKEVENVEEKAVEATTEQAPAVRLHDGPLFVVIAGSFANKDNALRFRRKLRKAGYDDAYIILPNESTRLFKVAAVGFPKRSEAIGSLDSLNQLTGIPAFIMRY